MTISQSLFSCFLSKPFNEQDVCSKGHSILVKSVSIFSILFECTTLCFWGELFLELKKFLGLLFGDDNGFSDIVWLQLGIFSLNGRPNISIASTPCSSNRRIPRSIKSTKVCWSGMFSDSNNICSRKFLFCILTVTPCSWRLWLSNFDMAFKLPCFASFNQFWDIESLSVVFIEKL